MFENIIGNEKEKELLKTIIESKKIFHSYMFVGKQREKFAKDFAKAIMCLEPNNLICNKCKSCIEFNTNNNIDFFEINPDGNSIKIEQIRQMTKKILEKPVVGTKKVYIINNSEVMTKEAQNSLLKTLEEPPEYVCIILTCENESNLLVTIKSRCLKIKFQNNYENIEESIINKDLENKIFNLKNITLIELLNSKEEIFEKKEDVISTLELINKLLINKIKNNTNIITECIKIVEDTKERLNKNSNFDMTIDRFLIKIWETFN